MSSFTTQDQLPVVLHKRKYLKKKIASEISNVICDTYITSIVAANTTSISQKNHNNVLPKFNELSTRIIAWNENDWAERFRDFNQLKDMYTHFIQESLALRKLVLNETIAPTVVIPSLSTIISQIFLQLSTKLITVMTTPNSPSLIPITVSQIPDIAKQVYDAAKQYLEIIDNEAEMKSEPDLIPIPKAPQPPPLPLSPSPPLAEPSAAPTMINEGTSAPPPIPVSPLPPLAEPPADGGTSSAPPPSVPVAQSSPSLPIPQPPAAAPITPPAPIATIASTENPDDEEEVELVDMDALNKLKKKRDKLTKKLAKAKALMKKSKKTKKHKKPAYESDSESESESESESDSDNDTDTDSDSDSDSDSEDEDGQFTNLGEDLDKVFNADEN